MRRSQHGLSCDIACKHKNKKVSSIDKKKKGKSSNIFKHKGATKRRKNGYVKKNALSLAELDYFVDDEVYEEAGHSWDLGKRLGLYAENKEEVVKTFVDAHGGKETEGKYTRSRGKRGVIK